METAACARVAKRLRRLGLAALFLFAASAAAAQTQQFAIGQRNLACGSPASLDDGWPIATPESVGLDGARLCGIAARLEATNANIHAVVVVRRGKLVFEQYFAGYDEPWGMGEGRRRIRRHDQARHALGFEERDLPAGRHRDRSQADQERRRARRQILSGIFAAEIAGLGQHHASPSADDVVGHSVGRESRLEGSARTTNRISAARPTRPLRPVEADRGTAGHACGITMAAARTCSATSSSVYRARRWRRLRARRCSRRLASPTGNG